MKIEVFAPDQSPVVRSSNGVATLPDRPSNPQSMAELSPSAHRNPAVPTTEQVAWAAKVAWANADKRIGRLRWRSLQVRDLRGITDPDVVALGLAEHLRIAMGSGRIRSVATVLDPTVEILNEQLISYAGYQQADGSILGDPRHLEVTSLALRAGWPGGRPVEGGRLLPGPFDVLPLLVQVAGGPIIAYDLPAEQILEIELEHPAYPWFAALGLRWYGVPSLARHRLHFSDALAYPVAFSGFSVAFEVAHRDLADPDCYDTLPRIARCLGLDPSGDGSSWTRQADLVLHQAVLHSFGRRGLVPPTASTRLEIYHRYLPAAERGIRPAYRPIDSPAELFPTPAWSGIQQRAPA